MIVNHYQILGIKRKANTLEIKQAYRKLAVKFHPDKNSGDKYFEERFKEIQDSYEVLSNSLKKSEYDRIYDSFFINNQKENYNQSTKSNYRESKTKQNNKYESQKENEKKAREQAEKNRVKNIKKNEKLVFEDKAWIFVGNLIFPFLIIGLFMFIKYRFEGYNKKSNEVCGISLFGFILGLILVIIIALGKNQ